MRLLLIAVISCSGGGPKVPAAPTPRVQWQVAVQVPAELKFNMLTLDGAVADPGERPVLFFREGLHVSTTADRAALSVDPVASSTRVVKVEGKDAWTLTLANGRAVRVAHDVVPAAAQWFDVDGGLVAVSAATDTTFAHVDDRGAVVWSAHVGAIGRDVAFLGTSHGRALFQLSSARGSDVIALDLAQHTAAVAVHGQLGRGVLAERMNQLAIVGRERIEVFDLATGTRLRELALPPFSQRTAFSDDATLGFDGDVVWMYFYAPPATGDTVRVVRGEICGYDVYDARSGRVLRTLASATWKQMTEGCAVRALLARPDGGVLAVRVDGPSAATVTKLDRAP